MVQFSDIKRGVSEVAPAYGVAKVVLFGSYARGEQTHQSDIDLVVDLSRPLGFKRAELCDRLTQSIGAPVDVVFGETQLYDPIYEGYKKDGKIIYES